MPGSEAAIRVTSRMPWPHSRTAVSSACSSRAATRLDSSCGVCETSATARSCASASITTGTARHSATSSSARLSTSVSVAGVGLSTQGRPSNRSAVAASGPDRSRPAIGCVPMYRLRSKPSASRSRRGLAFTLATSRYPLASPFACASAMTRATYAGGTATTARSTAPSGSAVVPAPSAAAVRAASGSLSRRYTVTPREVRARAAEVPISPVPMTAAVRMSTSSPMAVVSVRPVRGAGTARSAHTDRRSGDDRGRYGQCPPQGAPWLVTPFPAPLAGRRPWHRVERSA